MMTYFGARELSGIGGFPLLQVASLDSRYLSSRGKMNVKQIVTLLQTSNTLAMRSYYIISMKEDVQIKDPPTELRSKVLLVGSKLGYSL